MSYGRIQAYLRELIGLDAESLGAELLPRVIGKQMQNAGLTAEADYLAALRSDARVRQSLIEALVVPETWFFRNRDPFQLLGRLGARHAGGGRLRVLCLPCSTGEEAYTIAISLLQAGLTPEEFGVDAFDISEVSLEAARRALYGRNSFRDGDRQPPPLWFEPEGDQWRPIARVRECVNFRQGNLFTFVAEQPYDIVFCRNVLIYFDAEMQSAAVRRLLAALKPEGVFFVGHAEAAVVLREGLGPLPDPRCFAFTRKPVAAPAAVVAPAHRPVVARKAPVPPAPVPRPFADVAPPRPAAPVSTAGPGELDRAAALADQGRLDEAAARIRAHLDDHGPDAAAYYLLGVVHDAAGRPADAEAAYRKVLYLDPRHGEALAHLALLLEKRGSPEAARLWSRVRRPAESGRGGRA